MNFVISFIHLLVGIITFNSDRLVFILIDSIPVLITFGLLLINFSYLFLRIQISFIVFINKLM